MFNWMFNRIQPVKRIVIDHSKLSYYILTKYWKGIFVVSFVFSLLVYFIGFLFTILLLTSVLIYVAHELCDTLLYNPNCPKDSRTKVLTPNYFGIDYETHYIITEDEIKIHTQLIKLSSDEESQSSPTLIYFHGNAGNIGHRLANAIELCRRLKCNIMMVEYRGYGLSSGKPSESGLYKDAYAALKFLYNRSDICNSKIVLFGRSLGGAVAIGTAYHAMNTLDHCKPAAIIIENTFTNIPDIGRYLCTGKSQRYCARLFRLIPDWFYKNRYDSSQKISKIFLPTLFISGLADELIPHEMMTKLFNCSGSSHKEMHIFESGTHNFTWKCSDYYTAIEQFLATTFPITNFAKGHNNDNNNLKAESNEKTPLITPDSSVVNICSHLDHAIFFHQMQNSSGIIRDMGYEMDNENSRLLEQLAPNGGDDIIDI